MRTKAIVVDSSRSSLPEAFSSESKVAIAADDRAAWRGSAALRQIAAQRPARRIAQILAPAVFPAGRTGSSSMLVVGNRDEAVAEALQICSSIHLLCLVG